jgi:1-acyl-sn-glycerol-3-phosphate acyltransferase
VSTKRPVALRRPTARDLAAARVLLEPWAVLTAPRFLGLERVPRDRPFLLAGNHTLMGVLDAPLLVLGLHARRGVLVRALGDHLHFRIPLWRDLLARFGVVDGTRRSCRALMRAGESILVYPGGGREVFKRRGERYRLLWGDRLGFVRLAIEHGYPIVPVASVGAEECYDIVADGDDLLATALGRRIAALSPRPDLLPPLVRGLGFSLLPRPQRFYFRFGRPIETVRLAGRQHDDAACRAVRERVRRAVERGIRLLRAERRRDPERELPRRVLAGLRRRLARALAGLADALPALPSRARRPPPARGRPTARRRRVRPSPRPRRPRSAGS